MGRELEDHYNNTMNMKKEKEFDDLGNERFLLEVDLDRKLKKAKKEEIAEKK